MLVACITAVTKWARQQLQDSDSELAGFLMLPPKVLLPAANLTADGTTQWLKVIYLAHVMPCLCTCAV
jgi:hypothetical protein